jgi:hypothetical protein
MSSPGVCCDECFVRIAKVSTKAARLWLELCEAQKDHGVFGLVSNDSNASLVILERMGFLVTRDVKDIILVKVSGQLDDQGEFYFCGRACE